MVSQTVLVLAEFRLNEHLYEQFICDVKGTNQHLQLNRQVLLCLFCLQMCLYCPALFLTLFSPLLPLLHQHNLSAAGRDVKFELAKLQLSTGLHKCWGSLILRKDFK